MQGGLKNLKKKVKSNFKKLFQKRNFLDMF